MICKDVWFIYEGFFYSHCYGCRSTYEQHPELKAVIIGNKEQAQKVFNNLPSPSSGGCCGGFDFGHTCSFKGNYFLKQDKDVEVSDCRT